MLDNHSFGMMKSVIELLDIDLDCSSMPVVLIGSPVQNLGLPRKNANVFYFNPQMHKQQRPLL